MSQNILDTISSPADIKKLSIAQLEKLALELRAEMIAVTSQMGGHLAPSLGAVELVLACHYVLSCPEDKLIFDVGHQSYAHKILTGRRDKMYFLRQLGGISGFTKRKECIYDVHDSGHASDSLATALGLSIARDLNHAKQNIVAIIGDAAIGGGMAFEALNEIGNLKKSMVIILNDNEMSISPTVGALSNYLAHIRTSKSYTQARDRVEGKIQRDLGPLGVPLVTAAEQIKGSAKQLLVPGMLFEEFGFTYLGPIDGHNLSTLIHTLKRAISLNVPVLIHAVTKKGKGYSFAEHNSEKFHGISPFEMSTGAVAKKKAPISYTSAFAEQLEIEAEADSDILAFTAAMKSGTGLQAFSEKFPERFFDMGIAEEATVSTAAGAAIGGKKPVVCIYSTFLQRAFDQIAINVCEPNLDVMFAIDRAGLVGEDGPTHHGMFDMSYLRCLPNMKIISPSNEEQLKDAVYTALRSKGPIAVRYPRGSATGMQIHPKRKLLPEAQSQKLRAGSDISILAIGRMSNVALEAAEILAQDGIDCSVIDMIWLKPLDDEAVQQAANTTKMMVTVEEGTIVGGFSSAVLESMAAQGLSLPVLNIGIEDEFVEQGNMNALLEHVGLAPKPLAQKIKEAFLSHV